MELKLLLRPGRVAAVAELSRFTYLDRGYVTLPTANHCARSYKGSLHSSLSHT